MRNRKLVWSFAVSAILVAACSCGDDTSTGGGGNGGSGGNGTGATGAGANTGATGGGGATGGSGGVGGTGGAPSSAESCTEPGVINLTDTASVSGAITATTAGDHFAFCADSMDSGSQFPELVYQVTTSTPCILTGTVNAEFDAALAFAVDLAECGDPSYCVNTAGAQTETFTTPVAAGTYYFTVTSTDGPGAFTLDVACATPACGDTFVTGMEECDDGNTMSGDGCDSNCQLEVTEASLTCAGAEAAAGHAIALNQVLHLPSGQPYANNVNGINNGRGSCMWPPDAGLGESDSPDEVYRVVPAANGTLKFTIGLDENDMPFCGVGEPSLPYPTGCWDRAIYARSGDCDAGTEVACSDISGPVTHTGNWYDTEEVSFPVTAGTSYYLFVDGWITGYGFNTGAYVARIELTP